MARAAPQVYLQTVLKASPLCHTQIHDDTHFFRWSKNGMVDKNKCIHPDKTKCGRSPKVLGQWHALIDCCARHRRPVARPN